MTNTPATKYFATGVAAVVLTFGAYMIGRSNTSTASTTTNAAQRLGSPPGQAQSQGSGQNRQAPPGFGTQVTGSTLARLKSVVAAKYPGRVEQAMKLGDGSYVVHVIGTSGETHVLVSTDFRITGAQQGGPGGAPPQQQGSSATTS